MSAVVEVALAELRLERLAAATLSARLADLDAADAVLSAPVRLMIS
jgi:hypothetical protein